MCPIFRVHNERTGENYCSQGNCCWHGWHLLIGSFQSPSDGRRLKCLQFTDGHCVAAISLAPTERPSLTRTHAPTLRCSFSLPPLNAASCRKPGRHFACQSKVPTNWSRAGPPKYCPPEWQGTNASALVKIIFLSCLSLSSSYV